MPNSISMYKFRVLLNEMLKVFHRALYTLVKEVGQYYFITQLNHSLRHASHLHIYSIHYKYLHQSLDIESLEIQIGLESDAYHQTKK